MTSEEVAMFADSTHQAMNNILVLNNLFQYMDTTTLYKFRLISTRWNEIATKLLRNRNHSILFQNARRIEMFTEMATTSTNLAAQNFDFKLNYECFDVEQTSVVHKFFEVCHELVVDLTITFFYKIDKFETLRKRYLLNPAILLPRLENLGTFVFEAVYISSETYIEDDLDIWTTTYLPSLVAAISNVTKLIITNCGNSWRHCSEGYDGLTTPFISNTFQLALLSDLTLDCTFVSSENIKSLCSLHLKSFHMNFSYATFPTECFTKFLESQTDTLEYLDIYEISTLTPSNFIVQFPCMNALKSLIVSQKINICVERRLRLEFPTISYTVMFPKLEKLVYNKLGKILEKTFLTRSLTLRALGMYCTTSSDSSTILEIRQNFVALRKLEIICGKVCEDIFQYLPQLEELTLLCCNKFHSSVSSNNLDELFTGYAIEDHQNVKSRPWNVTRRKPYIGLLEKLKVLRLHVAVKKSNLTNVKVKTLTNFSVNHGFLLMQSLEVFITAAHISKRCIEDMEKKCLVIKANRCELESMKFPKCSGRDCWLRDYYYPHRYAIYV